MYSTAVTAISRIINGKSNPHKKSGAWFQCKETGRFGATDSFCCVMYDNDFDISDINIAQQPFSVDASNLFTSFNDEFNKWYSDNHMDNVSVDEVVDMCRECSRYKKQTSTWYRLKRYGIYYNINILRNVCEALSSSSVKIYYPVTYTGVKNDKPITIVSKNGIGLVMPIGS